MLRLFGDAAYLVGESQRSHEIFEWENSLQPLHALTFDNRPLRELAHQLLSLSSRHLRRIGAAGLTLFVGKHANRNRFLRG
jgi:hypothetical protein